MKDDFKLQSILSKINKLILGEDAKDDSHFDFQAQRIYGFIRDSYKEMKIRNDDSDYCEYNADYDIGIYIRNTTKPYFAVVLKLELSDLQNFQKFCDEFVHDTSLSKDHSVSYLEFFIGIKNKKNGYATEKMRCNYILADDPMFLDHAIEGCTHTFCKGLIKEFKRESFDF